MSWWRQYARSRPGWDYPVARPRKTAGFPAPGMLEPLPLWRHSSIVMCTTRPVHGALSEASAGRRSFAKARSVAMNRAIIGAISFAGSGAP
jgi:hypothetical protein